MIRGLGRLPGRSAWFWPGLVCALSVTALFLALPVLAVFTETGPDRLLARLGESSSLEALRLSLETSAIAMGLIVLVGTPAAYLLATRRFRGRSALMTVIELPLVLPPAVAGLGLLAALGPHGLFGGALARAHLTLVLSTAAVVVALVFVASPFYLRQAQAAFASVDGGLLDAARTLGASPARTFRRVALPLAGPGLLAGLGVAWARALGEFGATLLFAGSFPGTTQTAPLAIYGRLATDFDGALALAALLLCLSAGLLAAIKLAERRDAAG